MTVAEFVTTYGYAAVLAGTLLEGETILLLAGFAAHQGMLSLPVVMVIAAFGGTVGDQVFFWMGRRWGAALLKRLPSVQARSERVGALLRRWDATLVVSIRFLYGLRIAGPIVMGALHFSARRFAIFNAIGAVIWAIVIGGAGYLLGHTVEALLGEIEGYEGRILVAVGAAIVLGELARRVRWLLRRRAARRAGCQNRA